MLWFYQILSQRRVKDSELHISSIILDLNILQVIVVPWFSWYHYCTTLFNKTWTLVQRRRFKSCLQCVEDLPWWESLIKVPTGSKAKRLSSINHSAKTIHHHKHHHHHLQKKFWNLVVQTVLRETNLLGGKKRFNTTESSFDECSV